VLYNDGMKAKHWIGVVAGGLAGVGIVIYVYILQNNFDCFSCGFIDINYCSHQAGMCSDSELYVGTIGFFSTLFIIPAAIGYYIFLGRLESLYTYIIELIPLYILYWMFIGYFVEKLIRTKLLRSKKDA